MRRPARVLAVVLVLGAGLAVGLHVASRTDAVREYARARLLAALRASIDGEVRVGRVEGTLGQSLVLHDLSISAGGREVLHVPRVEADYSVLALLRGVVRLDGVALTAPRVRLVRTEGGWILPALRGGGGGPGLRVDVRHLRVEEGRVAVALLDATAPRRFAATALRVEAAAAVTPARRQIQVTTLRFRPRGIGLAPVDAAVEVSAEGPALRVHGLRLATARSRLVASGTLAPGRDVAAQVTLEPLAAEEVRALLPAVVLLSDVRATLAARGPWSAVAVTAGGDLGAAGRAAGMATLDLTAHPVTYRARSRFRGLDPGAAVAGLVRASLTGRARAAGRGFGRGAPITYALAVIDGHRVGRLTVRGSAAGGTVLARGRLAAAPGGADVSARIHTGSPPAYHATARLHLDRPEALAAALGGRVRARLEAEGRGGDVALQLQSDGLRVGGIDTGRVEGSANLTRLGSDRAAGSGRLAATGVREGARVLGDVTLALGVERRRGRTAGEVRQLSLAPAGLPPWRLARPARFVVGDGLTTTGIVLAAGDQEITLTGRLSSTGPGDATLTVARLDLAPFCRLVTATACAGELAGRVAVAGAAAAPRITAGLTAADLSVAEVELGTLVADARYAGREVQLAATLRHPKDAALRLAGRVPYDLAWRGPRRDLRDAPLELTLRGERVGLRLLRALAPETVRQASGPIEVDLRVTGSRAAPRVEGQVALDRGRLELAGVGVVWEDVRARAAIAAGEIRLDGLHARAGEGTLEGEGVVGVARGGSAPLGLAVRLHEFPAVNREAYEAALDGTVRIGGSLDAPEITGRLDVVHAIIRPRGVPGTEPDLASDPTITVLNAGAPEEEEAPPAPLPPLAHATRLDLSVHVARDARIRRRDTRIELRGDLRVEKPPFSPPRIEGRIRSAGGWYAFEGRRFTIDEGTLTFAGTSPAVLDVIASHRTRRYLIQVRLKGPLEKPELTFSSQPPLDQADILAILIFGRRADELGRGEGVSLRDNVLRLATGYAVPNLRDELGLHTLEVEVPGERRGRDRERGRVTVGRYLGEDVFLSLSQEFGAGTDEVLAVEYGLTPSISVRGSTSTAGDSAVDVFWFRRY
jgi:autotransporter translocation and assembly factor TamB